LNETFHTKGAAGEILWDSNQVPAPPQAFAHATLAALAEIIAFAGAFA
jgi:hypothetical protein